MQQPDALRATAASLERLAAWIRAASRSAVSATTVTALDTLAREGAMRVTDLAAREGITQPGMTALVNRLTESGWAQKLSDPSDRRATLVRITDAGRAALAERRSARTEVLLSAIAELDPSHQKALLDAQDALDQLARLPLKNLAGAAL